MPKAPKYQHSSERTKKASKAEAPKAAGNEVLINFILDKSGSMGSILDDTIGGFNTYIETLKADKNSRYRFSLTLFDTHYERRHVAEPLEKVPGLTKLTYRPSGNTALYDAIGTTVAAVEASDVKVDKVLTVILTDGQENSSREYRRDAIKALIERKEKEGNWTFVFLGAGLDAFAAGDAMGISHANSVAYDPQNSRAMYANVAHATVAVSMEVERGTKDFLRSVPKRAMRAAGMSRRPEPQSKNGAPRP